MGSGRLLSLLIMPIVLGQRGSVLGYTTAFRRCLLQCPTVTENEALHRYIRGLRDAPQKWVQMRSPTTLQEA